MLPSQMNTTRVDARIRAAAKLKFPNHAPLDTTFEHGHWWVTCSNCGAQWDAVDAAGPGVVNGFDFERVSDGDEGECK